MTKAYGTSGTRRDLEEMVFSSRGMSNSCVTDSFDFSFLVSPGMETLLLHKEFSSRVSSSQWLRSSSFYETVISKLISSDSDPRGKGEQLLSCSVQKISPVFNHHPFPVSP